MDGNLQVAEYNSIFLGPLLGRGIGRRVYVNKYDPDTVIKIEDGAQSFQNVAEWETWRYLQFGKLKDWLAPCVAISSCGTMLVQKRADPLPRNYKLPTALPEFITDTKPANFGLIKGKFVLVDYGFTTRAYPGAMKKVYWEIE